MDKSLFDQEAFVKRKSRLKEVKQLLKLEFAGIDSVIDQIVDSVSSWYCFNQLQNKPLIVNLWGMTGTGKTSLVKRLVSLLELENQFFKHDMRNDGDWELNEITQMLYRRFNAQPFVLLLDEFQQGRNYDETGKSRDKIRQIPIWELLDAGRVSFEMNTSDIFNLTNELRVCQNQLHDGAIVENGIFVKDPDEEPKSPVIMRQKYKKRIAISYGKHHDFVSHHLHEAILLLCIDRFQTEEEVNLFMHSMNGPETIEFLTEIVKSAKKPREVDATKSLVFVAGNLDQAYQMSGMISGEEDAEELYEESLKINTHDIKQALLACYRPEQISRLGNIHIIYPSLNRNAFESIIETELAKVSREFKSITSIDLTYELGIKEKIYEEGVIPSQGTRPLFSTIQYFIKSNLPRLLDSILMNGIDADQIKMNYREGTLIVEYFTGKLLAQRDRFKLHSQIETTRKNRDNDERYVTSVHEAGHVIASIVLLKAIPKRATSLSVQSEFKGFVQLTKPKSSFRHDILNWLSVMLSGGVAESLIFGNDHYPIGTYGDYKMATNYIIDLVKEGVINKTPGIYHHPSLHTSSYFRDDDPYIETEAKKWINEALSISQKLISDYLPHVLAIAEKLLENNYLEKSQLKEFAKVYLDYKQDPIDEESHTYAASFERKCSELKTSCKSLKRSK